MAGQDEARFAVVLEDKTSGAAASASQALEKLRGSIKRDTQELAAMQAAMKRLQSGTSVNVEAFRELQGRIDAQKNKIAEAEAKFVSLGGRFGGTSKSAKGASDRLKGLGESMSKLPGPIGRLGSSLSGVVASMGTGTMVALGLVAAFFALGAAVVSAGAKMLAFGVSSANARRNQELHFEAISRMRRGLIGMRASAGEVMGAVDSVSASTATSREQVARFAEILQRGGVRGANLSTALRAASIKAAALGEESGAAFAQMAVGASRAGYSVNRLAEDVQARFGGVAARRMLDLNVLSTKLHERFDALFSGLNVEPLARMFQSVIGFFDESTATGHALKTLVSSLFQPMINAAGESTPFLKRFFQGIIIAALRTGIAVLRVRNWFRDTFGNRSLFQGIDWMNLALSLGVGLFASLATGVAVFAGLVALAVAPLVLIGTNIYRFWTLGQRAYQMLTGLDWGQVGLNIANGITRGLERAKSAVLRSVRKLGSDLMQTFRSALDIHSPSRVFANLGAQIPAGIAVGVDAGADRANNAVSDVVDVPDSVRPMGASRGGTISISVGDVYVNGASSAEQAEDFRDQMVRVLEGLMLQMGGARV